MDVKITVVNVCHVVKVGFTWLCHLAVSNVFFSLAILFCKNTKSIIINFVTIYFFRIQAGTPNPKVTLKIIHFDTNTTTVLLPPKEIDRKWDFFNSSFTILFLCHSCMNSVPGQIFYGSKYVTTYKPSLLRMFYINNRMVCIYQAF